MNVVSFYAPRPAHPEFQDYQPFLRILDRSCRRFGHRHIVITDAELDWLQTFRTDLPDELMAATLAGQLAYLEAGGAAVDTLFVDADCVLSRDPAAAFALDFDAAFTTHPFHDCELNNGAMFCRGGTDTARFWRAALAGMRRFQWGDDQKALAAVLTPQINHGNYLRHGLKVRFLPVDPWNLTPDYPGQDCTHAYVLHFRGERKKWMRQYCSRWLDLDEPLLEEIA